MKSTILILSVALATLQLQAQWNAASLGGSADIAAHNGKLFCLTATTALQVSANNGTSWTDITTDTLSGREDFVVSSGDRLYVATYNNFNAHGLIYYSTDEGQSWILDTAGMPSALFQPPGKADVQRLHAFGNGNLIATFGSADGYYRKNITDTEWQIIPDLASLDPLEYCSSGDTVVAFGSGPTIMYSTDDGASFQSIAATGLPSVFTTTGVHWDRGQRMYLGIDDFNGSATRFLYSDDFGSSWTDFDIEALVGTNFIGVRQEITAVYGLQENVFFALYNDMANSTADIFGSGNSGQTFAKDTTGLTVDGFSTEFVKKFLWNDNRLFSVHSNTDIHYKGLSGPVIGIETPSAEALRIFPNPTQGIVRFSEPVQNI